MPTVDAPFHFGVWLEVPPYMPLTGQGIVQLLMHLARAAADNPDLRFTVACAPWAAADLRKLATEFGIPEQGFQIVTTSRKIPILLRNNKAEFKPKSRAWRERLRRRALRIMSRIRQSRRLRQLVSSWLATDSRWKFLAVLSAITIVALPVIAAALLFALAARGKRGLRRTARKVKELVRHRAPGVSRFLQFLRSYTAIDWVLNYEYSLLAREARRLQDIRVWFVPVQSSRLPELGNCPLVVAVPDTVYVDFPTAFPVDWIKTTDDRIRKLTQAAAATISYSDYVRDSHVVEHLRVPRERTFVIPHAHGDAGDLAATDAQSLTRDEAWRIARQYLQHEFRAKMVSHEPAEVDYVSDFPFHEVDYIFVSSQIRPHKNLLNVIAAFEILLRRKYLNIKLVTTGTFAGQESEISELLQSRLLQWDVISLPQLPPRVHAAFYRLAKLTVVSTLFEGGFPFPFSESLGVGTPVVMSSIPVTRELMPHALQEQMLFDPYNPDDIARRIEYGMTHSEELLDAQKPFYKSLRKRTWGHVVDEYVDVFRKVAEQCGGPIPKPRLRIADFSVDSDAAVGQLSASTRGRPLQAFLFMPMSYWGGVWESTRSLIQSLVEINRERRQLKLTLGVHADQTDLESLPYDTTELKIVRFNPESPIPEGTDIALALVDRFKQPLQAGCPYGVIVYDMIQRHLPNSFPKVFFNYLQDGIRPTIQNATFVVTTSRSTADDVCAEYELPDSRIRIVPVACEPHLRFEGVASESVPRIQRTFVLYPANAATHKGAEQVLRGWHALKLQLGDAAPLLVQCGFKSEYLSPSFNPPLHYDDPQWKRMRELVNELGLQEGHDVLFLGQVRPGQLRYLMENACAVINAALHDNGSFCIIEGHYFGRPVVSSRYAPAVELYERFNIPVKYFESNQPDSFAEQVAAALREAPRAGSDLEAIRRQLAAPQFSQRQFGEQFYNILLELASQPAVRDCA